MECTERSTSELTKEGFGKNGEKQQTTRSLTPMRIHSTLKFNLRRKMELKALTSMILRQEPNKLRVYIEPIQVGLQRRLLKS